ncbi:MAG: hypothetical protein JSR32_08440 [Proteobacteria bacterium]|nr:hypothetical protein [Pseudomonadota bacterium]
MKWIHLLLRLCIGITVAIGAYYLIRMTIDRMAAKKGFGDIVNPFGGQYLNAFLICLVLVILFSILLALLNRRS